MVDKIEIPDEGKENTDQKTDVKLDDVQQAAYDKGWRSKEEYTGDHEWVDAKEYLDRKPLYEGMAKANRRIKKMEELMRYQQRLSQEVEKRAYEKAKQELKAAKIEAYRNEQFEDVEDLDEKQKLLEDQQKSKQQELIQADFELWREDNDWYVPGQKLAILADSFGRELYNSDPTKSPQEVWQATAKEIKKRYPEEFARPIPESGSAPSREPADGLRGRASSIKWADLTAEQKRMGEEFVSMGVMKDKTAYIESLKKAGYV